MGGIRRGAAVLVIAATLVCASLLGALVGSAPSASASSDAGISQAPPPRTNIWPVNITLYGGQTRGWGFTDETMSTPIGPKITVYRADLVNLSLISVDGPGVPHNFFVDYDGDRTPNEPKSPDLPAGGEPLVWNFSADRPGAYTYYCQYHTGSMQGPIEIRDEPRPVNITLVGDQSFGWGFSRSDIRDPGPPLSVLGGTNVTFTLIANDSVDHNWFIDYDNNGAPDDDPRASSPDFNSAADLNWSFVADRAGEWTYRCRWHPGSMTGTIVVIGGSPPPLRSGFEITIVSGVMLGALAVVGLFAVVYHARAVRATKRRR